MVTLIFKILCIIYPAYNCCSKNGKSVFIVQKSFQMVMEGEVPDEQSSDEAEKVNNPLEFLSFFSPLIRTSWIQCKCGSYCKGSLHINSTFPIRFNVLHSFTVSYELILFIIVIFHVFVFQSEIRWEEIQEQSWWYLVCTGILYIYYKCCCFTFVKFCPASLWAHFAHLKTFKFEKSWKRNLLLSFLNVIHCIASLPNNFNW